MGDALESLTEDHDHGGGHGGGPHSAREPTMEDVESRLHQLEGMVSSIYFY